LSNTVYRFQRGEPILIGRAIVSGDAIGIVAESLLKPARLSEVPPSSVEAVATFQSEYRDAAGEVPAHWLFWLDAAAAASLEPRVYATDVRFSINGVTIEVTEPAWIILDESVSG